LLGLALLGVAWQEAVPSGWQFSHAFLPNKAMYFALGVVSAALPEDLCVPWRFLAVLGVVLTLSLARDNPLKALVPLAWGLCLAAQSAQCQSVRRHRIQHTSSGHRASRPKDRGGVAGGPSRARSARYRAARPCAGSGRSHTACIR
jgi:hypothetical protein